MNFEILKGKALERTDGYIGQHRWIDSTEVGAYFDLKLDTLFSIYTDSIDDIRKQYQSEVCSKIDNDVQKLKLQNGD